MKFKLLRNAVHIEVDAPQEERKSPSGLYLAKEEWNTLEPFGTVIAVGPDVKSVKKKDRVFFNRYAALMPLGIEDVTRIITEEDINAIVVEEKPKKEKADAKSKTS